VSRQAFHNPARHLLAVRSGVAEVEPVGARRHLRRMRHHEVERFGT